MDNFDTVSNCSDISNNSDGVSIASSLTGLSEYNEEFTQLRHLINPAKYPLILPERCDTPKQEFSNSEYEERIAALKDQLQNCLKQNGTYKQDIYNLEKNIELSFHDKIEKLLRNKRQLETQLENANSQIERLIKSFSVKTNKPAEFEQRLVDLENQREEVELENKTIKIKLNDLTIDCETKGSCISELKQKIAQQHVENQTVLKNSITTKHSLSEVSIELNHSRKSQLWYKEHLCLSQVEKRNLLEEIASYKKEVESCHKEIELNSIKLSKWKNKCDEIQLDGLKEKERLLKKFENVHSENANQNISQATENNHADIIRLTKYYEATIEDLCSELKRIKVNVEEQQNSFEKVVKENSELIAQCLTLQKTLQQNVLNVEQLENSKKSSDMKFSLLVQKEKQVTEDLVELKKEVTSLNIQLSVKNEEKETIENSVKIIREQFGRFKSSYMKIKEELHEKNKLILQLQSEKQELFMSNNWNICELEKLKEKDIIIKKLKETIVLKETELGDLLESNKKDYFKHLDEIKHFQDKLNKKDVIVESVRVDQNRMLLEKSKEIENYEGVLTQYKQMVTNYENQINNLQKKCLNNEYNSGQLKDNIKILQDEINKRDLKLASLLDKCSQLEKVKILDVPKLVTKKLGDSTINVEQPNEGNDSAMNNLEYIMRKFDTYFQNNVFYTDNDKINLKQLKLNVSKWVQELICSVNDMQNLSKCKCATGRNGLVKGIQDKPSDLESSQLEEIKHLKALLQVKELEKKEKQKKYDINYRTLLRKVKEHMKGRNAAEKYNNHLQTLYNTLSDETNSLKLTMSSKDYEIDNLKKLVLNYNSINNKLKQTMLTVEKEANKKAICDKCLDYATVNGRLQEMEVYVKQLEENCNNVQNELVLKVEVICGLKKEVQELLLKISVLEADKKDCNKNISKLVNEKGAITSQMLLLEEELRKEKLYVENLNTKLDNEIEIRAQVRSDNKELKMQLKEANEKHKFLSNEINMLHDKLRDRSEMINEMQNRKNELECKWQKREQETQKIIIGLKTHLYSIQNGSKSLTSEKFFLQRLCNDLKVALESHVNHNKVLKEQINYLSKERQGFNSLPTLLPNISSSSPKYDDNYISQLLQAHKAPHQDKPLSEIQGCLNSLKEEIFSLQEQIAKKNIASK